VNTTSRLCAVAACLLLFAPPAQAGWWDSYTDYWDRMLEQVMDLDLYGTSAQLPAGIFGFKMDWNGRTAGGRYDAHRKRAPLVMPIEFEQNGETLMALDLGASGAGGGVTWQFSYGITDPLDFYIELPFQYMDVQLRPKLRNLSPDAQMLINGFLPAGYPRINSEWFDASGRTTDRYLNEASTWLLNYLPRLGRPALLDPNDSPPDLGPGKSYHSNGLVLADINCGFSWQHHNSKRWAASFTGRVFFPTGNIADPDNALTLGTGPEIDRGVGAWGFGASHNWDIRLFKYKYWVDVVLSGELTAAYRFKAYRRYPNFPQPTDDGNQLLDLLDPARQYFPDMADLSGKGYSITPGMSINGLVSLGVAVTFVDFAVSLGWGFNQEPELNADPRFELMVKSLEMQAAGHLEVFRVAAGVNLLPLYIPLTVHYQFEKNIGGRNFIYFTDNHWITVKGFIPTLF
jgi:hypothetical protein